MKTAIVIVGLSLAFASIAETPGGNTSYNSVPPVGTVPNNYAVPGGPPAKPQNGYGWGVNLLNDDVFKLSSDNPAPQTRRSTISGTERYVGEDANYNSEQRGRWLQNCGAGKEQDPKTYRECYEKEKQRELQGVRRKISGSEAGGSGIPGSEGMKSSEPPSGSAFPNVDLEEIRKKEK